MRIVLERGPRRPWVGVGWSLLSAPLAAFAILGALYATPLALVWFALAVVTWVKAWAAFAGVTHVGPR